jgi:biopolymer transport protein ExbD
MEMLDVILVALAIVLGTLYFVRRQARVRREAQR